MYDHHIHTSGTSQTQLKFEYGRHSTKVKGQKVNELYMKSIVHSITFHSFEEYVGLQIYTSSTSLEDSGQVRIWVTFGKGERLMNFGLTALYTPLLSKVLR